MNRCQTCVEKKLRKLLAEEREKNKALRETTYNLLEALNKHIQAELKRVEK